MSAFKGKNGHDVLQRISASDPMRGCEVDAVTVQQHFFGFGLGLTYYAGRTAKPFGMAEPFALPAYQLGRLPFVTDAQGRQYSATPDSAQQNYDPASLFAPARARGGSVNDPIPQTPNIINGGMLRSSVPGRTDKLNIAVPSGAYVIPADIVAGEGQGNSEAGAKKFQAMFTTGPLGMSTMHKAVRGNFGPRVGHMSRLGTKRLPKGASVSATKTSFGYAEGGAQNEGQPTPILAAGGEFIVHPHVVRRVGRGDLKTGHRILDAFVVHARAQHLKQIKALKPPVKS